MGGFLDGRYKIKVGALAETIVVLTSLTRAAFLSDHRARLVARTDLSPPFYVLYLGA